MLRLVAGPGSVVAPSLPEPSRPPPMAEIDARDYGRSSQLRVALDNKGQRALIEGIPPLQGIGTFAVIRELVEASWKDRREGRAPESHTFVSARTLSQKLRITEESLRRRIHSIRTRIADAFTANAGLPLSHDALIENARWRGYRLNPAVLILAPEEIAHTSQCHDSEHQISQLDKANSARTMD